MIYDLSFDDYTDNDMVFHTKDNFHVIVDKRSILYLAGSDITYDDGLMGTGFVINNDIPIILFIILKKNNII